MTNCSENLQIETREKHTNNFFKRLQYSGFDKEFRYDVVNAANNAYKKKKQRLRKVRESYTGPRIGREQKGNWREEQKRITGIRKEIVKQ